MGGGRTLLRAVMFPLDSLYVADFREEKSGEGGKRLFIGSAQSTEGERKKMFSSLKGGENSSKFRG